MAKGKLTKSEKYIIEGMFEDEHTFQEIAAELGRATKTVEKHLRSLSEQEPDPEPPADTSVNGGLFIRKTAEKGNKGVSVMTEAESSRSEMSKKTQSKIKNRYQSSTHKISEE